MDSSKRVMIGLNRLQIAAELMDLQLVNDEKSAKMRAGQLAQWIYRKAVLNFDEMTDIPQGLREKLNEHFNVSPLSVATHRRSTDQVDKLLVHRGDDQVYECVLLPYRDRTSCCLSSQVGCPMGCAFCATGLGGFDRNLTVGEIVAQYLLLQNLHSKNIGKSGHQLPEGKDRISHIVFMGMGEPLLNFGALREALQIFHDEIGLSYRHLTVSTVGIVPKIYEIAKSGWPINLALSLHSPLDSIRDRLMPVNQKWKVAEVMQAMREYQATSGRKITIEYLLISEITDTLDQADELARLVHGVPSVINLIPFNYVATEDGFKRPSRERVRAFKGRLIELGVNVTERMERGHDIAAACGQLAGQHTGKFARRGSSSELPVLS